MDDFISQIVDFFKNAGWNILYGFIILVVGLVLVKLFQIVLRKILNRTKRDEAMVNFIVSLVYSVLVIVVIITSLATMGINTASIIAVVGTCGVAIGLALKDSLGNIASGIMIIFNKPFKKNDYVELAGEEGRISKISLFNTSLLTDDNTVIIVPNSAAVNNPIINYEGCTHRRLIVDVTVDKGSDIADVRAIVTKVAKAEARMSSERDFSFVMSGQDSNGILLQLRAFAAPEDYWDVKYRLTENVYNALRDNGYLTPNMRVDVYEISRPSPILMTAKSRRAAQSDAAKGGKEAKGSSARNAATENAASAKSGTDNKTAPAKSAADNKAASSKSAAAKAPAKGAQAKSAPAKPASQAKPAPKSAPAKGAQAKSAPSKPVKTVQATSKKTGKTVKAASPTSRKAVKATPQATRKAVKISSSVAAKAGSGGAAKPRKTPQGGQDASPAKK